MSTSKKIRVLVVEDEALIGEEIRQRLERLNYEVIAVVDQGVKAIAITEEARPDLVLMDIRIKGPMDGIEAGKEIYRRFGTPVLHLTAHSDEATLQRAISEAAFGYVLKPFDPEALQVAIQVALNRHRSEQQLREGGLAYDTILSGISDAVIAADGAGNIRFMNPVAEALTGWQDGSGQGLPAAQILRLADESSLDAVECPIIQVLSNPKLAYAPNQFLLLGRDGSMIPVEVSASCLSNAAGNVIGASAVLRDLRKRRSEEIKFRGLLESAPDAMVIVDARSRIVLVNSQTERLFGYSRKELIGQPVDLLTPDRYQQAHSGQHGVFLADPKTRGMKNGLELYGLRKDGTEFPVEISLSPLRTEDGILTYATIRDITDRKHADQILRNSEERYRTLVNHATDGIFILNQHGRYLDVNPPVCKMLGYSLREMLGLSIADVVAANEVPRVTPEIARLQESGSVKSEWVFRRKDGSLFDGEVSAKLLPDSRVLAIVRDITERKRSEEALRGSEERFRTLVRRSPVGFTIRALEDGRCIEANDAYLRMLEFERDEIVGKGRDEMRLLEDPNAYPSIVSALAAQEQVIEKELKYRTKSGKIRDVRASCDLIQLAGKPCIMTLTRDVTEQNSLEQQLRQAQKMEAIGRLAGGVAHDFNNLLCVIMGYAELLENEFAPESPSAKKLDAIQNAVRRAAGLTSQLLAFSRRQPLQPRILDLNGVVRQAEQMLSRLIAEDVELQIVLAPQLRPVNADPGQLIQTILNLAINARDAMPGGGKLTIATSNSTLDESTKYEGIAVNPGQYVLLSVSDTGIGMEEKTKARIFDPFFTTKAEGKGTGLGLANVYGVVRQSEGYIFVDSSPGSGSTFRIFLPASAASVVVPVNDERLVEHAHATETILLVEDERALRDLIADGLRTYGYTVLAPADALEALHLAEKHPGPIHALVTDVIMPHMSGTEVAQILTTVRPNLKVVYMSGHVDDTFSAKYAAQPDIVFIAKPFPLAKLALQLRELLDPPGQTESTAISPEDHKNEA